MEKCIKDIEHVHAFELLSNDEEKLLNNNKSTILYNKGEIVMKQAAFANNILYIKSGLCKVYIEGEAKNIILTLKPEKTFMGISSLYYDKNLYLYSASALEDCEINLYDKNAFKEILNNNTAFSNEIIKYLNHNSARIFSRILCIAEKNARGKVADMLLCFANNLFGCYDFIIPLSRQELAEFAGLSMENTIRILKEFEKDNLISLNGKEMHIINIEALERISQFG